MLPLRYLKKKRAVLGLQEEHEDIRMFIYMVRKTKLNLSLHDEVAVGVIQSKRKLAERTRDHMDCVPNHPTVRLRQVAAKNFKKQVGKIIQRGDDYLMKVRENNVLLDIPSHLIFERGSHDPPQVEAKEEHSD